MKKAFGLLNLLLIAAVCVGNYYYHTIGGLAIKAACSSGFVLIGVVNLIDAALHCRKNLPFALSMTAGLTFAMLGDIFLGKDFILGAALFAVGHVLYFIAQCFLVRLKWRDLLIGLLIFAAAAVFLLLHPGVFFRRDVIRNVSIAYALIISMMTGKSLSNLIRAKNIVVAVTCLGCVLFFFSDLMLALGRLMHAGPLAGILCMATYYPAQCLLAGIIHLNARRSA